MERDFLQGIEAELGELRFCREECPGVYSLSCRREGELCREYYLVRETAPMISAGAKKLGRRLRSCPGWLAYALEDLSGGQKIVEYEAGRFRSAHGLPLPEGVTLHSIAMDGMELNPEYFGTFPVPAVTPWGPTLRHRAIDNGVYWLETQRESRVLALHPLLRDTLSDAAGKLVEYLDGEGGFCFFPERASCIPVFELMQLHRHWEASSIHRRALENAIWRCYPEYAAAYNAREAVGGHSLTGLVLRSLGEEAETSALEEQMITLSPGAGTDFCTLLD